MLTLSNARINRPKSVGQMGIGTRAERGSHHVSHDPPSDRRPCQELTRSAQSCRALSPCERRATSPSNSMEFSTPHNTHKPRMMSLEVARSVGRVSLGGIFEPGRQPFFVLRVAPRTRPHLCVSRSTGHFVASEMEQDRMRTMGANCKRQRTDRWSHFRLSGVGVDRVQGVHSSCNSHASESPTRVHIRRRC